MFFFVLPIPICDGVSKYLVTTFAFAPIGIGTEAKIPLVGNTNDECECDNNKNRKHRISIAVPPFVRMRSMMTTK